MTTYYNSKIVKSGADTLKISLGKEKVLVDGEIQDSSAHERFDDEPIFVNSQPDSDLFCNLQGKIYIQSSNSTEEEWLSFVNSVVPKSTIENNFFSLPEMTDDNTGAYLEREMVYNKSFFRFENYTKVLSTRTLPNYALLATGDDLTTYNGSTDLSNLSDFSYYENYVENLQDIFDNSSTYNSKNSNMFLLKDVEAIHEGTIPYYLRLKINAGTSAVGRSLVEETNTLKREKFLFQFINNTFAMPTKFTTNEGQEVSLGTYDVLEWLSGFDGETFFSEADTEFFLSNNLDLESRYVNILYNYLLYCVLKSLVFDYTRDVGEIFDNNECKSEVIGYKIEKFLDAASGAPVQTFYLHGSSPSDFIDSQLKHGQKYVYNITSLVAVYGSQYSYGEGSTEPWDDDFMTTLPITITPSFKIFEVPFASTEEVFVEMPPNVPMYSFGNESGKKEIKILLNSNFVEAEEEFVNIIASDSDFYTKVGLAQKNEATRSSYMYSSGRFEIYRITTKPTSYLDFDNGFVSIIESTTDLSIEADGNIHGSQESEQPHSYSGSPKSAEFLDVVSSNKKYYYLFRELSEHNNPSNPTDILEVELIEDADETYVVVNPFRFEEERNFTYKKEMKRFMQIVPNPQQSIINEEDLAITSATELEGQSESGLPVLGTLSGNLWGKNFKIRLTSKHTGKKIDVNLKFGRKIKT